MGGLGSRRRRASNSGQQGTGGTAGGGLNGKPPEYPDDGTRPMPSFMNPFYREAARDRRLEILAQSGRSSTNLTGAAGTRPHVNTFLGGVQ